MVVSIFVYLLFPYSFFFCCGPDSFRELLSRPMEFTEHSLISAAKILEQFPETPLQDVLQRVYPFQWTSKDLTLTAAIFKRLKIDYSEQPSTDSGYKIEHIHDVPVKDSFFYQKEVRLRLKHLKTIRCQ